MSTNESDISQQPMELGQVLSALADPLRRRVVAELASAPAGSERTCASFGFPVTKATLTHHFRILRESGLIHQVSYGNKRTAVLRREEIDSRFPGLLALIAAEFSPLKSDDVTK